MYDELAGSGDLLREAAPPDDAGAIRFRRVRDLGDVVNVTFRFLRENARELGRGLLVIVGPVALLASLAMAWAQRQMERVFAGPAAQTDPLGGFGTPGWAGWFGVAILVGVAVQLLVQAVVLGYVERYRRGEAGGITPARLWEATKRAFRPVASTTLILLGLFFASAFILLVPLLGALVWIVGLVYLFPIITLLYVERVAEGDAFWTGFEATRTYVRGHWGPTFGLLFVVGLILVSVMLVLSIPAGVLQGLLAFNALDARGPLGVVVLVVDALFGVLIYAAYLLPTLAAAFQYFNLVERAEGAGLQAEIDAVRGTWAPPRPPLSAPPASASSAPAIEEGGFRGGGFYEGDEPGQGR